MHANGSGVKRLTSGPDGNFHPTWAPDGSLIAFARLEIFRGLPAGVRPPTNAGIYEIRPDGTSHKRLTKSLTAGSDDSPDWSPDGKSIVFVRRDAIHLMNADGSGITRLTSIGGASHSFNPAWSPDGRKILFEQLVGGSIEIVTMNADGTGLTRMNLNAGNTPLGKPDWQPVPAVGSETPTATSEPSVSSPSSPLPAMCHASQVTGDFDGNGQPDAATVALTKCLLEPSDQRGRFETEYSLDVRWPPSDGIVPLPDCGNVCTALAATDLNLDGIDEFVLKVDEGSSYTIQVYELPASEAFEDPAGTAPPGGPGFPPDQAAQFGVGGSVTAFAALGCPGNNEIIVEIAKLDSNHSEYAVHETVLRFDPIDAPPFGQFTVVSTRDYKEPFDNEVGPGDRFEPGGPCWMDEPNP